MGLVGHRFDSMPNVTVRFHYDKMRRVSLENYNYYYAPLPRTPFSLGLAIPAYENTYIQYEDVVTKFNQLGINMTQFFAGQNWKVHQEWYELVALRLRIELEFKYICVSGMCYDIKLTLYLVIDLLCLAAD